MAFPAIIEGFAIKAQFAPMTTYHSILRNRRGEGTHWNYHAVGFKADDQAEADRSWIETSHQFLKREATILQVALILDKR